MFVRKKVNKSGSVSVQIVDKTDGYKIIKTIGVSDSQAEINHLVGQAEQIIRTSAGQQKELCKKNYSKVIMKLSLIVF